MSPLSMNSLRQKVIILAIVFVVWFVIILGRLVQLQVIDHSRLKAEVLEQSQNEITILPKRGTIYDRNGKILARSLPVESVFYSSLKDEPTGRQFQQVSRLKVLLDLSEKEMSRIAARIQRKDSFIWIKRKIDAEKAERVKNLDIKGIFLHEENKRFYPQGLLAAHVLGGLGIDDNGLAGVEIQYDQLLKGEKGKQVILRDARRKSYSFEILNEPRPGKDLHLTIDETIQYIAESELEKAVTKFQAAWGTVVILDPYSGEILAMANQPAFDPNDYPPSNLENAKNRAIQHIFEPGSTFKIVTAAAARELGKVSFSETYDCRQGSIVVGGSNVRDHKRFGVLTFPEVFIESSNVGAIMIAQEIGEQNLYRMIKAFGFGERTGIDLPGEEKGICHPLSDWRKSSFRIAIGYEISATAIQILRAMNVYATRGRLVSPSIARKNPAFGEFEPAAEVALHSILTEKTTAELTQVFKRVVEEGTGQSARLPGFDIAGKTGTAQKIDPLSGHYLTSRHLASFVGFVPVENPVLSMIVVIDDPTGDMHYGGQVAAPVFREIAVRALRYLCAVPQPQPRPLMSASMEKADRP